MRRAVFGLFCTIVSLVLVLASPTMASATSHDRLGTHLGHFDLGAQIGILGHIQRLVDPGYPVVVNVDPSWTTENIQSLATAADGLKVVIRITGRFSELSGQNMISLAGELNGVEWGNSATPKPIVVLGNELNNLQVEWGDTSTSTQAAGGQYQGLYVAFSSTLDLAKYDLAPVALDQYNTRYPWRGFGDPIRSAYINGTAYATNIYGSELLWSLIPDELRVPLVDKRSILTEWGPMPPDLPLADYERWYINEEVPEGVEFAIALVSNTCLPGAPQFGTFYWVNGAMYSLIGNAFTPLDPRLCPDGENIVNDESRTVDDEVSGIYVYKDIFADVVRHGGSGNYERALQAGLSRAQRYVMSCAPQFWIGAQVEPEDVPFYWSQLNEQVMTLREYCGTYVEENRGPEGFNEPNCVFNPITANFQVLNTNLSTPLYRRSRMSADGEFYNSNRAESFESFFGVNTRIGRETGNALLYSPNAKMLSQQGQCVQAMNYLKAIDVLCKEDQAHNFTAGSFEDDNRKDEQCALDNLVTVEGAAYDQRYLEIYREVRAYQGEGDPVEFCLMNRERLSAMGEVEHLVLDEKLMQIQPIMKNAFKIGYLVYYNNARYYMEDFDPQSGAAGLSFHPDEDPFGPGSRYFHPVYRNYAEMFNLPTFDIIPFLVPAGVFSSNTHEEILVNPADATQDYEPKADAAFDSAYTWVLRGFLSPEAYDQILMKGTNRKAAIGSAIEYGMTLDMGEYGTMWNGYNDSGNERPFIHCPFCDPAFSKYPPNIANTEKIETNYDVFASVIWHRINGGIYAKEVTEHLFTPEPNTVEGLRNPLDQMAPLPDEWNRCQVAPELVWGETARDLSTPGTNSLWGSVKTSITNLRALIRAPSGMREDKYNYEIRGYLLLPEEYGFLADTEAVLMKTLLPLSYQTQLFNVEMKDNDFSALIGETDMVGGHLAETPEFNRFLRLNGQVFTLGDNTPETEDDREYFTESLEDYRVRVGAQSAQEQNQLINTCFEDEDGALECFTETQNQQAELQRRTVTVTSKLNSWNPGWNEGLTDLRPLLPGGIMARGIFTIMAQILSPIGGVNYQLEYCGLEDYWQGGGCFTQQTNDMLACEDFRTATTVVPDVAEVRVMVAEIADQYQIPRNLLWGIFRIEGGEARNLAFEGGGEVVCTVNDAGAVGPMQHLKNVCRRQGDFPEDQAAFGKNVCDLRVSLEVAADRISRFSRAEEFKHNGAPNWYWIAGQYYWGSRYKDYKDMETGKCLKSSPAVDNCPAATPDYCSCAVEGYPLTTPTQQRTLE